MVNGTDDKIIGKLCSVFGSFLFVPHGQTQLGPLPDYKSGDLDFTVSIAVLPGCKGNILVASAQAIVNMIGKADLPEPCGFCGQGHLHRVGFRVVRNPGVHMEVIHRRYR